ncbi:hypothetical protein [Brachyspira pulli]|uniref:hypothetical protein n=1 Tax=Brachyspira pulli TaxID=310721 RepID=UPI0030058E1A
MKRDNIKDIIFSNIYKIDPDKYYNTFDLIRLFGTGITPTRNFITKKIPIEKRHVITLKEHSKDKKDLLNDLFKDLL